MKLITNTVLIISLIAFVAADIEMGVLRRVCDPKQTIFHFNSIEEVRDVLNAFEWSPTNCPEPSYHASFEELNKLLQPEYLKDVCAEATYWRIRDFHTKFITPYVPDITGDELKTALLVKDKDLDAIPESLRRFFILFVKQIQAQCLRNIIARLDQVTGNDILEHEYQLVREIKEEGNRLFGPEHLRQDHRIDRILIEMRRPEDVGSLNLLHVQVKFGDVLMKIQDTCKTKFRPIFQELFAPMIRLANLGYIDTVNTKSETKMLLNDRKFSRWADIIEMCESMKHVDVIQDSSTKSALADMIELNSVIKSELDRRKVQTVIVLSDSEAKELKAKIEENTDKHDKANLYTLNNIIVEHQPIEVISELWINNLKLRDDEVKRFRDYIKKRIDDKTNGFILWRRQVVKQMRLMFQRYKLQFKTRDNESAAGMVAIFMDKHCFALQIINTIIGFAITATITVTG